MRRVVCRTVSQLLNFTCVFLTCVSTYICVSSFFVPKAGKVVKTKQNNQFSKRECVIRAEETMCCLIFDIQHITFESQI